MGTLTTTLFWFYPEILTKDVTYYGHQPADLMVRTGTENPVEGLSVVDNAAVGFVSGERQSVDEPVAAKFVIV